MPKPSPTQSDSQIEPPEDDEPDGFLFVCRNMRGQHRHDGNVAVCWRNDKDLGWCVSDHDEPVKATTMLHEEDDKTVWVPVCDECAEHAV